MKGRNESRDEKRNGKQSCRQTGAEMPSASPAHCVQVSVYITDSVMYTLSVSVHKHCLCLHVCVSRYTLSVSVRTGLEGLGVPALEEAIERAAAPPAAPAPPLPIIFRALRSLFLRFSRGTGVRGGR